ncbi:hypothetical protein FO519_008118 [Halicephalobus sp. NKZ332]|nr:hypothetical protein FO519_008118 [Halicephalobus sp. NKZ332]
MFTQSPLASVAAQMIASQAFVPKQFSPIIPEPTSFDWTMLLNEFIKGPVVAPQINLQEMFLAQINEWKNQLMNQQFEQMMKAMSEVSQKIPSPPPIPQFPSIHKSQSSPDSSATVTSRKRPSCSSKKSDDPDHPHPKRSKQLRKLLAEDTETNSPVSGMYIKELSEVSADDIAKAAELDETASYVHISEESKRKIAEIPNVIGDSICSLCKVKFEDIFKLAMHKCPRIVHEEYKCPECDKVFSCPANLASHRRWHGPRPQKSSNSNTASSPNTVSTRESSPSSVKTDSAFPAIQLFTESLLALASSNGLTEAESALEKQEINVEV